MTLPPPSPSRGPKAIRVAPDQLLDAAQAVFSDQGLKAASLRAIARKAGCDPALIYYHFKSKEALFEALLERRFPPVTQEMERLTDPADPRSTSLRLWAALGIYYQHLKDDAGIRAMVRGEIMRGAEGLGDLIEARIRPVMTAVSTIIKQGIDRGELRPDLHPLLTTFFLMKMQLEILDLLPIVLPRVLQTAPDNPIPLAMRTWFELFWRGVAADPSAPLPSLPDPALS
jgi:AcrR family transcriptional regulator